MSKILSFRGLLEDGGQDTINLETIRGTTGYKIVKFQIIGAVPGTVDQESVMKIYKIKQTTSDGNIDFSDNTLLGVAYWESYNTQYSSSPTGPIIFDNEIFNQDIYVTHTDVNTGQVCNYYIELESMDLNVDETTVATLKNIRNTQ
jgi:hypothetical protein